MFEKISFIVSILFGGAGSGYVIGTQCQIGIVLRILVAVVFGLVLSGLTFLTMMTIHIKKGEYIHSKKNDN